MRWCHQDKLSGHRECPFLPGGIDSAVVDSLKQFFHIENQLAIGAAINYLYTAADGHFLDSNLPDASFEIKCQVAIGMHVYKIILSVSAMI